MDDSTLCKLQFVVSLVRCVLDLAESRRIQSESAMSATLTANDNDGQSAADNAGQSEPSVAFTVEHACFLSNSRCHLEQLVLYVRALQLLSSAMHLARIEMKAGRLASSVSMKNSQFLLPAFCSNCCTLCALNIKYYVLCWHGSIMLGVKLTVSGFHTEMKWKVQWFKVRSKADLEPA